MAKKFTFTVGLEDKDLKKQLIATPMAALKIEEIFVAHETDCTISSGYRGVYRYKDGSIAREESVVVVAYQFSKDNPVPAEEICADIKTALNQESVAVEITKVNSKLM